MPTPSGEAAALEAAITKFGQHLREDREEPRAHLQREAELDERILLAMLRSRLDAARSAPDS